MMQVILEKSVVIHPVKKYLAFKQRKYY